jgi:Helix-turn-helix domain
VSRSTNRCLGIPAAVLDRLLAGENPILVWREHVQMKVPVLTRIAGMTLADYVQFEQGRRIPSLPEVLRLADALGVSAILLVRWS